MHTMADKQGSTRISHQSLRRLLVLLVCLLCSTLLLLCVHAAADIPIDSSSSSDAIASPIRSLSGAAHLVVAAGSVGIYHVDPTDPLQSEDTKYSNSGEKTLEGALLYFAPVSPYYFYLTTPDFATHFNNINSSSTASLVWWPYAWSTERGYAPCQGYKKQDRIAPIEDGLVTVKHVKRPEAGLVCFSYDGVHYQPTGVTYEVLDVTVTALLHITPHNTTTTINTDEEEEEEEVMSAHTELRLRRRSSGVLRLRLAHVEQQQYSAESDEEEMSRSSGIVTSVRLASSAYCMQPRAALIARDLPVTRLPKSAFTTTASSQELHSASSSSDMQLRNDNSESVWGVVYHNTDVIPFTPSRSSTTEEKYAEEFDSKVNTFSVCIAVTKTTEDINRRYPALRCNETAPTHVTTTTSSSRSSSSTYENERNEGIVITSYPSSQAAMYVMEDVIHHRLCARTTSLAATSGKAITIYTLLPLLRVTLYEPPVSVRGMWLLAPQSPLTVERRTLLFAPRHPAETQYKLAELNTEKEMNKLLNTSAHSLYSAATTSRPALRVTQYSSPVLVFDAEGLETGMLLRLARSSSQCTSDTSSADNAVVPLSAVWLTVIESESESEGSNGDGMVRQVVRRKMYMAQLDLRHTSMSAQQSSTNSPSTTTNDNNGEEETWYLCFSYSTMAPQFVPLRALRFIVRRLRVWGLTRLQPTTGLPAGPPPELYADADMNSEEEEEERDEKRKEVRTHVHVTLGWQGMLILWGMDLSYWSQATFDNSVITLIPYNNNSTNDNNACESESESVHYMRIVRPIQDSLVSFSDNNKVLNTTISTVDDSVRGYGWYAPHVVLVPSATDFFAQPTTMTTTARLCITVPFTYSDANDGTTNRRTLLNDVRVSIDLPRITGVGTQTSDMSMQTITVAEESDDVVLPMYGDGLHEGLGLFLMRPDATLCNTFSSHATGTNNDDALVYHTMDEVAEESLSRITLIAPYDLPARYYTHRTPRADTTDNSSSNNDGRSSSTLGEPVLYMSLPRAQFTSRDAADRLFGSTQPTNGNVKEASSKDFNSIPVSRTPRRLCLFIPTTTTTTPTTTSSDEKSVRGVVLPIPFQLIVAAPVVRQMANVQADIPLVQDALHGIILDKTHSKSHEVNNDKLRAEQNIDEDMNAFVVYGAHMDLIVTGIGLIESETEFVPAFDCSDPDTFLFREPLRASAWPSLNREGIFAQAERSVDSSESLVSWFITLTTWHTTRLPTVHQRSSKRSTIQSGQVLSETTGLVWCVHYRDAAHSSHSSSSSSQSTSPSAQKRFVSTGLPYRLIIPALESVRVRFPSHVVDRTVHVNKATQEDTSTSSSSTTYTITVPVQDERLGEWCAMELRGPLVDITFATGYALDVRLVKDDATSCTEEDKTIVQPTLATALYVVNGSTVLLPRWLSQSGRYKLCARLHLSAQADYDSSTIKSDGMSEYFELQQVRLDVITAEYTITALNHISSNAQQQLTLLSLEHGEQAVWPVEGTWLSVRTQLRLVPYETRCHIAQAWPDLTLHTLPPSQLNAITDSSSDDISVRLFVTLEADYLRLLPALALYQVCLKPHRALGWRAADSFMLEVKPHTRQPTQYEYFAQDGSDAVVRLTAIGPTRLTQTWSEAMDIVAPVATTTQLRLWCTNTSTASNSNALSLCASHRRVMFVKPLTNTQRDPCFVDAKAVSALVQRGPYVIEANGLLTLPQNASAHGADMLPKKSKKQLDVLRLAQENDFYKDTRYTSGDDYPSLREPWRMCLEIGPEKWRATVKPHIQLRYVQSPLLRGFRSGAGDNASAMSMPLEESDTPKNTMNSNDNEQANQTLVVYVNDSSRVYYLSGYGIRTGLRLRFGARCTLSLAEMHDYITRAGTHIESTVELLAAVQGIHNPFLYERPLRVENDDGLFVLPREHLSEVQEPVALCYSNSDDGTHYVKTNLMLQILPTQLQPTHYLNTSSHVLEHILRRTLLLPQGTAACVNVTDMLHNTGANDEDEDGYVSELAVGSEVVLARNCHYARPHYPTITVTQLNMLNLTTAHIVLSNTGLTLSVCVKSPPSQYTGSSQKENERETRSPAYEEEIWHDSADEAESGQSDLSRVGYQDSGIYVRVMRIHIEAVTRHIPTSTATNTEGSSSEPGLFVVQRADAGSGDSALLTVHFASNTTSLPQSVTLSKHQEDDNDLMLTEEAVLRDLDSPAALVFFGLIQLRVGNTHCDTFTVGDNKGVSSRVRSDVVLRGLFHRTGLSIQFDTATNDDDATHWYALLPLTEETTTTNTHSDTHSSSSNTSSSSLLDDTTTMTLCMSVDGGRHFYAVDQSHVMRVTHAPTLTLLNEEEYSSAEGNGQRGNTAVVYVKGSWSAGIQDTRYTTNKDDYSHNTNTQATSILRSTLVRDVLWSGNVYIEPERTMDTMKEEVQRVGFMSDGILYLAPAHSTNNTPRALLLRQSSGVQVDTTDTGLQVDVRYPYIRCVLNTITTPGATERRYTLYVRSSNAGQILRLETVPDTCVGGLVPGMRLRATRINKTTSSSSNSSSNEEVNYFIIPVVDGRHTSEVERFAATSIGLQLPASLRHSPGGTYALCIINDDTTATSYSGKNDDESSTDHPRACLPTGVQLIVLDDTTITSDDVRRVYSLNGQTGQVHIMQGSHNMLSVEGSVAGLAPSTLRIAFITTITTTPSQTNNNSNVSDAINSLHKALCANITRDADINWSWWNVSENELLRLPAHFTVPHTVNINSNEEEDVVVWPMREYIVCYSVDFGLHYRPLPTPLTLYVDPPSVDRLTYTSPTHTTTTGNVKEVNEAVVGVDEMVTSRTAAQLYRFARTDITTADDDSTRINYKDGACGNEGEDVVQTWQTIVRVNTAGDTSQEDTAKSVVRSRAAMYYYHYNKTCQRTTNDVQRDTILQAPLLLMKRPIQRRMRLAGTAVDAYSRTYSTTSDIHNNIRNDDMPTVVAAVAVLRSARVGHRCRGIPLTPAEADANYATLTSLPPSLRALVIPVFLLNLQRGLPWRPYDSARFADELERIRKAAHDDGDEEEESAVRAAREMNPVLSHTVWLNNTRTMRKALGVYDPNADVSFVAFVHRALRYFTMRKDIPGKEEVAVVVDDGLLVCLSVDGVNFHSPYDLPTLNISEGGEDVKQMQEEVKCKASLPMYLRMDETSHGSYVMRDIALTLRLSVHTNTQSPNKLPLCAMPLAGAMSRVHHALATELDCDPVVLVLELQPLTEDTQSAITSVSEESTVPSTQEYVFSLSVMADSILTRSKAHKAAPDLLLDAVMLLRNNVTGLRIMRTLLPPSHSVNTGDSSINSSSDTCVMELQTMNFTLSNGLDLHAVPWASLSTPTTSISISNSPDEQRWRMAFLAIPHNVRDPTPPPPPVHLVSDVMWWILVALVLISPVVVAVVVIKVHRRHTRQRAQRGRPARRTARDVTVVPVTSQA